MYKLVLAMNIAEAEIVFIKRLTSTNNKPTKAPNVYPITYTLAILFATWYCHNFCFVVCNLVLS